MITNVYIGVVAQAAGTVDAITATYLPAPTVLADKMLLWFRATGANTTTTPTFKVGALDAKTIVKQGGQALAAGDIPGEGAVMEVCYDETAGKWELINPATSAAGTYEPFVQSYTTAQIAALTGMTLRQRVFNTTDNDYEYYDGTRWVKEAHPKYKVYKALLTQSGTNAPVATVLENTLGGTIVWTRLGVGSYQGALTGAFPASKTWVNISQPLSGIPYFTTIQRSSDNNVNIITFSTDFAGSTYTEVDDVLSGGTVPASIEIHVSY